MSIERIAREVGELLLVVTAFMHFENKETSLRCGYSYLKNFAYIYYIISKYFSSSYWFSSPYFEMCLNVMKQFPEICPVKNSMLFSISLFIAPFCSNRTVLTRSSFIKGIVVFLI